MKKRMRTRTHTDMYIYIYIHMHSHFDSTGSYVTIPLYPVKSPKKPWMLISGRTPTGSLRSEPAVRLQAAILHRHFSNEKTMQNAWKINRWPWK